MKLKKCYIENFGTLSQKTFVFEDGLTVLLEDNGFGKTTLAAFIKAILYGIPKTTKRALEENPREKYKPWQGGNYGGYIEFEANGKSYRAERFFGARSDSFKLYDLSHNSESSDFSSRLGEELFGVDAASYEKSTFLPQHDVTMELTGSLSARIGNLVDDTDDLNNYETACAILEKASRRYALKRGEGGLIYETKRKLTEKTFELELCEESARQAEVLLNRLEELESELLALESQAERENTARLQAEQWAHYRELLRRGEEATAEYEKKQLLCGGEFPSSEELRQANFWLQSLKREPVPLSEREDFRLGELREFFRGGLPEKDELEIIGPYCAEYEFKVQKLQAMADTKTVSVSNPRRAAVLLIAAAVLLFAGGLLAAKALLVAVGAFLLGGVFLAAGVFSLRKKRLEVSPEREALVLEIQGKRGILERFFARFYPPGRQDFSAMAEDLNRRVLEYQLLLSGQEKTLSEAETIREKLNGFLKKHGGQPELLEASLQILQEAAASAELLSYKAKEAFAEAERYRQQKGLQKPVAEPFEDVSERLALLSEERTRLQLQRERLLGQAEKLQDVKGETLLLKEQLSCYEKEYRQVNTALSFLQKARENLSGRYVNGIDRRLQFYLAQFSPDFSGIAVDRELNITADRFGEKKSADYLSRGYQNLLEIALRLSLIDVMYEGEQPFLILDDPLVNLDDGKIQKAKEVLLRLAQKRQIIYLTCHSSRVLK